MPKRKRPRRVGPLTVLRGELGAPAASGLTYVVLYAKHHPPPSPVHSSPFRWFIAALDTRRAAVRPPFQARYPSSELVGVAAVVFGLALLRRRYMGGSMRAVAESQRRFLATNWDDVERAAARSGMGPEEIAEVRRKVFGG